MYVVISNFSNEVIVRISKIQKPLATTLGRDSSAKHSRNINLLDKINAYYDNVTALRLMMMMTTKEVEGTA